MLLDVVSVLRQGELMAEASRLLAAVLSVSGGNAQFSRRTRVVVVLKTCRSYHIGSCRPTSSRNVQR